MKSLYPPIRLVALGTLILAWCSGRTGKADLPATVLSQGPVGYWRLNETTPPPSSTATNIGSLASAGDGRYIFNPKRAEPGTLTGSSATSVRFLNPGLQVGYGGS